MCFSEHLVPDVTAQVSAALLNVLPHQCKISNIYVMLNNKFTLKIHLEVVLLH